MPEEIKETQSDEVTKAESSTAQGAKEESPPSLSDTVAKVAAEAKAAESEGLNETQTEEVSKGEDGQEKKEDRPSDESKSEAKTETAKAETAKAEVKEEDEVPFHKHPRWQEVQRELKDLRVVGQQMEQLAGYCRDNEITEEQFKAALEMAALMNRDPMEARKRLKPYVEALDQVSGDHLPADLAKKVEDGVIDADTAKETARLRAEIKMAQERRTRSEATVEQQRLAAIKTSLSTWEQSKMSNDPDYQRKFALVRDRFNTLWQAKQPKNPAEAVALAETAYKEVNNDLDTWLPKRKVEKHLNSKESSTSNKTEPKTLRQVIAQVAARHQ